MKWVRKLTALLLAATLLLATVEPAVSAKEPPRQEAAAELQEPAPQEEGSWEEKYPYGGFALGLSELVLQEDGATHRLTVRRLGGATGKASAVISYQPAVTETESGVDYSSAISADDIAIQVENPLPITRYQPWGMPPAPEATQVRVVSREGTDGQGEPCTILFLDGEGEEYQWYALQDGVWDEIQDGTEAELPVAEEDLALYDFRCVFRQGETRCCTDSYGGEPYEKPEEEELEPAPEDLELNPEPSYSELDLTQGDTPYDGLLFELCFAEGESEKDLLFTAKEDSLPELREFAALTIVDSVGGDVVDSMNTLLLAIEDDDQELDEPSQIGFTVSQAEFDQADGAASLTVRRTGGVTAALTVDWALEPGTAQPGVDYADDSGQLTFYGPQTEQTIRLELVDDQKESLEGKTLTVRLSHLLGDSRATLSQDSCEVSLFNSGTGEGQNLASVLSDTEAQDVSSQVREDEGAPVSSGEIAGEQVTAESCGESSVEWDQTGARSWNSYNGNGTISFSGGNWNSTVSYPQSLDSTGGNSNTVRVPNMGALYQSLSGTVSGGAKFASGWDRLWHGDEEYAYTAFEMFLGSSSAYWDCEPRFSRPNIFKIRLTAYNTFTVRQSWPYQQNDGKLSLEVRKHDSCGSKDTINARSKVSLRRRPFHNPFRLEICTANDQDNTTPGVPHYTEQNYKNLIKSVSITDGGSSKGTLYEGSSFDITLGDTNLVCTSADLVNSRGARQISGSVADRRISFHHVVLPPEEQYTVRLTLARRQTLSIDLNGSMETDAGGVPVSGAADQALALLRSRSGGAKIGCGVSCSQSRTNLPASQKNGIATIGMVSDAQCVNFSLPKEDIIVFNGKTYAGDETIWLEPKDLALQTLTFYYYEKDFIAAQRPMRASIDATALYYDGNANGMIDGYWDAASSTFVLDPDSKDVFVDRLSDGDYEETMFTPVVDETGFHQYFLRAYYSANPVCLTVPSGHSASERMQVMPGFITNVTDPAAYLSLTEEQKQYRTIVSGKTKLSEKASPTYSADNHPKYTAAASAYSYVDVPLGGDASPSRAMTNKDLGVNETDGRFGEDYILKDGLVYYYAPGGPNDLGDALYLWEPAYRGNLLYPFADPQPIYIPHSLAGSDIPVTKDLNTWYQKTDGSYTSQAPSGESDPSYARNDLDYLTELRAGETGKVALNNYLGSFGGNDTYSLTVQEQEKDTASILSGRANDTQQPAETVTHGTVGTYPNSEYMLQNSASQASGSADSSGQGAYEEFSADAAPTLFSFSAEALSLVTVKTSGYTVSISLGVPLASYSKESQKDKPEKHGPKDFLEPAKKSVKQVKDFISSVKNSSKGYDKLDDGSEGNKKLKDNEIKTKAVKFDLSVRLGIILKYDPLSGVYQFSEAAASITGAVSLRLQYRFTCLPILCVYAQFGARATVATGLDVKKNAVLTDVLPKGESVTLNSDRPQYWYTAHTKGFSAKFSGRLYLEVRKFTDTNGDGEYGPGDTLGDPLEGTHSGYLESNGGKAVEKIFHTQRGFALKEPVVVIFSARGGDSATIQELSAITDSSSQVYWSGVGIDIQASVELGVGVDVAIAKAELYAKGNIGIAFRLADQTPGKPSCRFDSFKLGAALGFRVVFLCFKYQMDMIEYHLQYKNGKGWSHGWSALGGKYGGDTPLRQREDGVIDVTITLPDRLQTEALENGVTGRDAGIEPTAFDTDAQDFQVSGYGASVNAYKLVENTATGYDYRIVTVGKKNYVVYTGTNSGAASPVDQTELWLSELDMTKSAQGKEAYGLVNPIQGQAAAAERNYIPVEGDGTGDLDFTAWAQGDLIHVVWVSYASPSAVSDADAATGDMVSAASRNTVVKHAVFDTRDTDPNTSFSTPSLLSDPGSAAYCFLPASSGDAAVYAQSVPYPEQEISQRLAEYESYLDDTAKTDGDGTQATQDYLEASKEFRLSSQSAMLSLYGGNSRLTVVGPEGEALANGTMYVSRHQENGDGQAQNQTNEILTGLAVAQAGDSHYLAYATQQDLFQKENGTYTDLRSIYRLYLRSFSLEENTGAAPGEPAQKVQWGEPYLLRTLVNGEQDSSADGVYDASLHRQAGYQDPYFANLSFLTGRLGDKLSGEPEEFRPFAEAAPETFLLFEMNGSTYVIDEKSLQSITQGDHTGTIHPFFTYQQRYGQALEQGSEENLGSGKSQVVIGSDGDGNVAAVYTGSVSGTVNNAIYIAYWDPEAGAWSDGVMLAMNHMDVYERSVSNHWDGAATEAAYLDEKQGGGMDSLTFANLQIALGRGSGSSSDEGVQGSASQTDVQDSGESLYGDLIGLPAPGDGDGVPSDDMLFAAAEKADLSAEERAPSPTSELLILTQGSLQNLQKTEILDDSKQVTGSVVTPEKDESGSAKSPVVNVYAISYGKGSQQVGAASIQFAETLFTAGSELSASVNFKNVGDAAIRGSGDQPILTELRLHDSDGSSDALLASWRVPQNISPGQTVSLETTDQPCAPLPADLGAGDYFYFTVSEDEDYVSQPYRYRSDNDLNISYRYDVEDKPELSLENLSAQAVGVTQDGKARVEMSFDAANRGKTGAEEVFVQLSYVSGYDSEGQAVYSPLDLTGSELRVSQQRHVPTTRAVAGRNDLENGVLYLGTDDSFYTAAYYITQDEYQKILSSYYSTTEVEGWSQDVWNGQTYWFDGARFGSAYAAYQAGQEAVSGWADGGNGYYYSNRYASFFQAKAAADADRRMDYIRTAAQMEPLPQEEKGRWAKDSGSGEYFLKSLGSYRDALAAYQEALRDNTQNIKPDYLRTVRGTVPVDPQKFLGKTTGSLELRAELFSLSSSAQQENGLYSSDHQDEYCQSNNSALASVEHKTFFSSVPRLVLSQNSVRQIPVSASTTRGNRPSIRVMEVEDDHKELNTLAFRPAGGSATVSGKLSILGTELGSGVIHLLDESTNTTYPIAYTVAGPGDGVNIFCDDDQFAFYNADGKAWSPDLSNQDWAFQAVPSWTDQKLEPCLDNLSQGQKGAYFTFQSQAESFSFTLVGSATVTSDRFPQSFSVTGTMADPASAVIDFGNQEGVTHTITVKVTSDQAWFDVIKPTYGEDYLPNDDPNAPGLYWSRSFPGANSVQIGETVELTVYAVDAGGLQALSWNGRDLAPGDPGFQAHNGGMWSYTFPVTENGSFTVTAIDDQGLATTRQVTVDWFHDGLTTGCGRAPSLSAGLVKSDHGVETPFTGGTLSAGHVASGDVFLKIDAQGEGTLSYSSFHTGIGDFDTAGSLNRITSNGWYLVKLSGPESWSAKLFAVDCFESAPSIQVVQTPSRLPNSVTLSWTASKDRESTEKLSGVTLNGQSLLGGNAADSTSFSGEVTVRSGGVYTFLATDAGNVTGQKQVKVTVPVDLSDPDIFTQTDDWGQPGGPGHGTVTMDFSKVSGGDYVNYTGAALPLEDYHGSYQYAVAEEADYSAFSQDKDWLDGLSWTDAAHDDVLTAEGLPAGKNGTGYVVLVRDALNPQDYSAMTVQHILMRSAAIEAPSLTAQNASGQNSQDGQVAVEAVGGMSNEYQFAILPQEEGAELTAQDFQAPGVTWLLSRGQEGDSAVFDDLEPGTYRVAVRSLCAQGSALGQARQELFQAQRAYQEALQSVESNALDRTGQVNTAHSAWQAAPEEDVQEKEAAYQAALEDLGDQAQELLRLDQEWLTLEEGPKRTAARKAYQAALYQAWRDWCENAQRGELSAASAALAAAETAYQAQAALASSQSAGEYGSSAAPAWDGMLLTQAVKVGVESAPDPEIHTGSAAAGAKNGSLLASAGLGDGTLHYQFALLPLPKGEEPVNYSDNPAAIGELGLAWRFADDPSAQPEQALFEGLPAGEYQVFLRPVYDPDPQDDYDINDRLYDSSNVLPWGIDDLTALRNAYLDAQNAIGKDPSPQLQAALSLAEDTYLLALSRLEEQADQAYSDDPGRYASVSWASAKVEAHAVPSGSEEEEEPEDPDFEDIHGHWAEDSILFVARRGLFQGVSETRFDPEGGMTRAMLVTVLHRLARLPESGEAPCPFEDVPEGAWYEEAVRWAYRRGVVKGVSETRFAPEQKVTREQAVAMLWRYLRTSGLGGGEQAGLEAYPDAGEITDYAQEAFSWAVAVGVVQGTSSGLLDPGLGITRAQAAAILERTVRLLGE